MDLPVNVSTGEVVGRYIADVIDGPDVNLDPDAQSVQGRIVFTASVPYLPNPTAGPDPVTIMRVPIVGVLDQEGYLCTPYPGTLEPQYRGVRLIATDDPDIAVTDWTWDVTYIFEPINGHKLAIPAHGFSLPSGGTVDLTKVAKVPSSPGYSLPQAEAAVLRAEEAALTSAQDAASALAAALRSEQAAAATDQGITDMLSDPDTQSGGLLAEMLDPKANSQDVVLALSGKADRQEVESLIASKADAAETTEALGTKANQTSVDSALGLKADKLTVETALADKASVAQLATKADLQSGKVPVAQLPTDALVTDANVAAQVNGAQTGAAIDSRITTQVTPVVEQITADYVASDQAVIDAAAAAVDANPVIAGLESRVVTVETTAPVHQTDENLGGGHLDNNSQATDLVYRKTDGQVPDWVMDRWAPRIAERIGASVGHEYTLHEGRVRRTNPDTAKAGVWGSSTLWLAGDQLATLLQSNGVLTVYKGGKSGEGGEQTAARIGAIPAKLTFPGNLIPASGSAVVTSTNVPAGIYLMPYSGVISGVHGTLSATATELTFTRTTAGSSVSSPADSEMTSDIGEEYQYAVNIINIGKNGMSTRTAQATIDLIDACFEYLSSANTRVLVLGHFADSNWWPDAEVGQKLQEINAYCKNKYGPIFMDIHALITSPQVWDITGVVPTQADLDQQVFQGYGVKPGSLSVDNGHFNTAGNNALTYLVQATIDNLHWNGA